MFFFIWFLLFFPFLQQILECSHEIFSHILQTHCLVADTTWYAKENKEITLIFIFIRRINNLLILLGFIFSLVVISLLLIYYLGVHNNIMVLWFITQCCVVQPHIMWLDNTALCYKHVWQIKQTFLCNPFPKLTSRMKSPTSFPA